MESPAWKGHSALYSHSLVRTSHAVSSYAYVSQAIQPLPGRLPCGDNLPQWGQEAGVHQRGGGPSLLHQSNPSTSSEQQMWGTH